MRRRRGVRRGFTVTEMVVVCLMTVILSAVIGSVWSAFCYPALDVAARCRIAQEANLAAAALAHDLGGYFNPDAGPAYGLGDYRYRSCDFPAPNTLRIHYELPAALRTAFDTEVVITYRLDDDRLVRSVGSSATGVTVASGLTALAPGEPAPNGDDPPGSVPVALTFRSRGRKTQPGRPNADIVATYTLVTPAPETP